jgi:cell division septum initiation protein DivIVA
VQWAGDIEKIMNCMSNSSKKRLMDCKEFIKNIEKCEDELVREETKYQNEVKKCVKAVEKLLEKIDGYEKEQDSIVTNITKPSKNKDRDGNFYLIEYKKLENQFKMLFGALADRGKEIFGLMKVILDSEKGCLKKLKEVLEVYQKGKNTLCRENQFDERLLGALVVVEDSIAESRKQYFNRYLLSEDQI